MAETEASRIRYAQCWEDADVLLDALAVQPGEVCLSIGSGGENSLSLLTRDPARVVVVDMEPAQIACLELKAEGFRRLAYTELLELLGAVPSDRRATLYARVRGGLSPSARAFWDARPAAIAAGVGSAGRFERYFALFRRYVLPLIHTRAETDALFRPRAPEARRRYYDTVWNNRRWRLLFRLFFSRAALGRFGRDPEFFRYIEGSVARRIMVRVRHGLADLDPADNPYLQWIAYGRFVSALPHALRAENFEAIRGRIDRLEPRPAPVQRILAEAGPGTFSRFNLSDVFEYLPPSGSDALFEAVARAGRPGARVAYWNMLAQRRPPARLAGRFQTLEPLGRRLHERDRACFYRAFWVDELT